MQSFFCLGGGFFWETLEGVSHARNKADSKTVMGTQNVPAFPKSEVPQITLFSYAIKMREKPSTQASL